MAIGLIVVDLQSTFHPKKELVQNIEGLVGHYDVIVATRFHNAPKSMFRTILGYAHAGAGDTAFAFKFQPTYILDKSGYGLGEEDIKVLKQTGITEWHLCGLETDACVLAVAFSLWNAELRPILLEDLCQGSTPEAHTSGLQLFLRQFGEGSVRKVGG